MVDCVISFDAKSMRSQSDQCHLHIWKFLAIVVISGVERCTHLQFASALCMTYGLMPVRYVSQSIQCQFMRMDEKSLCSILIFLPVSEW